MNRFRVIVEYTDGTSELVTMLGDFNITEEESLKLVETQLKQSGRYEKVIAMKVKQ